MIPKSSPLALKHKAAFRLRRKNGLQPLSKPWDWISMADLQDLAAQAYRVASFEMLEGVLEDRGGAISDQQMRETFACNLADTVRDLVIAHAVTHGNCWPVTLDTPPCRNYPQIAADLRAALPHTWRPQYPLFEPITPPVPSSGGIGGAASDVAASRRNGVQDGRVPEQISRSEFVHDAGVTLTRQKAASRRPEKQTGGAF